MALQLNTAQDGGCHRTWKWAPGHGHRRRSTLGEQIRKLRGREQTAGERRDWQSSASTRRPGFSVRGKQTSLISNEDSADSRGPPRKPGSPPPVPPTQPRPSAGRKKSGWAFPNGVAKQLGGILWQMGHLAQARIP